MACEGDGGAGTGDSGRVLQRGGVPSRGGSGRNEVFKGCPDDPTVAFLSKGDIEGEMGSLRLELIRAIACECGIDDDMVTSALSAQK